MIGEQAKLNYINWEKDQSERFYPVIQDLDKKYSIWPQEFAEAFHQFEEAIF